MKVNLKRSFFGIAKIKIVINARNESNKD